MPAYILRRRDNSKNGVEQMCKISGIRPDNNMDNNFGFFNAKLYCEGALILVCVFVEL